MAERGGHDLQGLRERLRFAAILVTVVFLIGVVGFYLIGGGRHTWVQAVYMTANVLTTAGFREAIDISNSTFGSGAHRGGAPRRAGAARGLHR